MYGNVSQEIYTAKVQEIEAQVEERRFVLEDKVQHDQDQMRAMYQPPPKKIAQFSALWHGVGQGVVDEQESIMSKSQSWTSQPAFDLQVRRRVYLAS